ncbi:MAG TPA: NADH-quinone oxidoreductase subunit N [Actinomycetota bacterium]
MHVLAQAAEAPLNLPQIDWRAVAPELALAGTGLLVLLVVAWWPRARRGLLAGACLAGIAVAAGLTWWNWDLAKTAFEGAVALDGITRYARLVLLAAGALAVLMAAQDTGSDPDEPPEVFPLLLFALTGMMLLAAASDLLVVFIALELLSLSLYVLAGATRHLRAQEAAMKYFLLGAFSSAFLAYGIALCYGATRTTNLLGIARAVGDPAVSAWLLLAGVGLLAVGFCFKVAAVPFHSWTPDVYQGSPTWVTAFMAAGTKAAGFAAFLRVFAGALGGLVVSWRPVIAAVAVATMLVGSVLAVVQQDLKRMLAYSSIAHAGYLLIGLAAAATRPEGASATMFYLLAYAFMVMGAFMVVQYAGRAPAPVAVAVPVGAGARVAEVAVPAAAAARPAGAGASLAEAAAPAATATVAPAGTAAAQPDGRAPAAAAEPRERSSIDDFRGFGRRHFWPAALLAIFLLSLAGIPPLSGFWAKYYLFQAGIDAGLTWLVVVAVVASVISAFFYLRVIVAAFLSEPTGEAIPGTRSWALNVALGVAGVLTVGIGLAPQALVSAAQAAGRILG